MAARAVLVPHLLVGGLGRIAGQRPRVLHVLEAAKVAVIVVVFLGTRTRPKSRLSPLTRKRSTRLVLLYTRLALMARF